MSRRLANLANELGIAGTQVLREHFKFSEDEALKWFDLMLEQAQKNRKASLTAYLKELENAAQKREI
jgi:hypothetical protein